VSKGAPISYIPCVEQLFQMICVYICKLTIDHMSDPLKWWAENGVKKLAPIAAASYRLIFSQWSVHV